MALYGPVSLESLQALDAIDRHGSFAAAAAALYRVPSAISYTVAQLEADLGISVFDRSGHRAVLTPAGRLLLDEGRRILVATRELGAASRRLADRWEPELRLAVDGLVAPQQLWPAIAQFHEAHPAINIRMLEETLGGTWEALIDDRADLAIGLADPPAMSGLARSEFSIVDWSFCCAPDHPLAHQPGPLSENDLRAYRAVVVADSARSLSPRNAHLLDGQARLTVSSMRAKLDALEQGLGVGYIPARWVESALARGRLVCPAMMAPRPAVQTFLLWRHSTPGRALHWFIDRLSAGRHTDAGNTTTAGTAKPEPPGY